jgi:uncharacterized SAM-binding protein YcdF (DUF218 family)
MGDRGGRGGFYFLTEFFSLAPPRKQWVLRGGRARDLWTLPPPLQPSQPELSCLTLTSQSVQIDYSREGRYPAVMYVIKKIVGMVTEPGTLVFLLLSYGFLRLLFARGSKKRGLGWIGLGLLCFYLFTTAPLPNYLAKTLESRYEPLTGIRNLPEVKYIVVLSGGMRLNKAVPPTSELDESSALRVVEGIRLFHLLGEAPVLIMTGSGRWHDMGTRMVAFAQSLGVPPGKLIPENKAKDTYGNAMWVRPLVKNQPFLLVTSAVHLPRALLIFQKLGMKPIPAPGDFRFSQYYSINDFFPTSTNLATMEIAVHEYLGLAYLYLVPSRAGE